LKTLKISRLISNEKVANITNIMGSASYLQGRCTGLSTGVALERLGEVLQTTLGKSVLLGDKGNPKTKASVKTLNYLIDKLELKYVTTHLGNDYPNSETSSSRYYLTYKILRDVEDKDD